MPVPWPCHNRARSRRSSRSRPPSRRSRQRTVWKAVGARLYSPCRRNRLRKRMLLRLLIALAATFSGCAHAATCSALTDADCGPGFVVAAGSGATTCYGAACGVGYAGAADQLQCCEDRSSTCTGAGITCGPGFAYCSTGYVGKPAFTAGSWDNPCRATCAAVTISDTDCGEGWDANLDAAGALCATHTCAVGSASAVDQSICCTASPSSQPTPIPRSP